uniref:Uncharacterized protein n=1 Tax=Rhizophora mucronata TaxID=61149 RepID=A0A2P2IJ06_RHIMU
MVKMRKPKMAGNQASQNPEEVNLNPSVSFKGKWQVHYARFFNYLCLPSTCPNLRPMISR